MTKILWATAVVVLAVGFGVIIWGFDSNGGSGGGTTAGEATQVLEHTDDGDQAVAAVSDGDGHADADGQDAMPDQMQMDEAPNADLEAAPKDALALVQMGNLSFTPNVIEVGVGEVLEIAIQNVEPVAHDFTIDRVDAQVHVSYLEGTGEHKHMQQDTPADVHFALTEAGSGIVHLKINEPGEYVFYCSVPGHRESGMEGKLIVS